MKIIVETPNISASDKLIELINKKLEKVEQVSDQVVEARVYLKTEKSDINKNKICEIKLVIPGNDLFTSDQCATFEEAIANATDSIRRQLIDWKQRISQ